MRTSGCTRPSKLRLPESTEHAITSPAAMPSLTAAGSGPEFPMQVVHP